VGEKHRLLCNGILLHLNIEPTITVAVHIHTNRRAYQTPFVVVDPINDYEFDGISAVNRHVATTFLADGNRVMRGMSAVPNHPTKLLCLTADYADCRTEILMITAIRNTLVHRVSLMHAMG